MRECIYHETGVRRLREMALGGLSLGVLGFFCKRPAFCSISREVPHKLLWLPMIWQEARLALFSLLSAIKNQATGHYILNGKGEEARSRSFIDLGVEWEYNIEDDIEMLHTDGPLHDAVVVLVGYVPSSRNMVGWSFIKSAWPAWSLRRDKTGLCKGSLKDTCRWGGW